MLEKQLERLTPFLEIMSTRIPPIIAKQWLAKKMEEKRYLTWSELADDSEFMALFQYPSKFYQTANSMATIKGWMSVKIDGSRYFYADGFDIESIRRISRWKRYRADDPRFHEFLVKDVIVRRKRVNLLEVLREWYPSRSYNWMNEVIDGTYAFIKKNGYKVSRKGDLFRVTSDSGEIER